MQTCPRPGRFDAGRERADPAEPRPDAWAVRHPGPWRCGGVDVPTVPPVEVDRSDGTVRLHERVLRAGPVRQVPLSRRYLLG